MKKDNDLIKSHKLIELGFIHTEKEGSIQGWRLDNEGEWGNVFIRLVVKPNERIHSVFADDNHVPYVNTMRDVKDLMRMFQGIEVSQ